jgi:hypothetical protein
MLAELKAWLEVTCSPERVAIIETGWDLLESFEGPVVEETQLNIYSMQGIVDNTQLLDNTTTELAFYSTKVLDQFNIYLDDTNYTNDQQDTVNSIISTILELDKNELIDEILAICRSGDSTEEIIAQLVHAYTGADETDVLFLIKEVSPKLIERIIEICSEKISAREIDVNDSLTLSTEQVRWLRLVNKDLVEKRVSSNNKASSTILDFMFFSAKLGLPLKNYVTLFTENLTNTTYPKQLAEDWLILGIMANLQPDTLLNEITLFFEILYPDLNESMVIRKELIALINYYKDWR